MIKKNFLSIVSLSLERHKVFLTESWKLPIQQRYSDVKNVIVVLLFIFYETFLPLIPLKPLIIEKLKNPDILHREESLIENLLVSVYATINHQPRVCFAKRIHFLSFPRFLLAVSLSHMYIFESVTKAAQNAANCNMTYKQDKLWFAVTIVGHQPITGKDSYEGWFTHIGALHFFAKAFRFLQGHKTWFNVAFSSAETVTLS